MPIVQGHIGPIHVSKLINIGEPVEAPAPTVEQPELTVVVPVPVEGALPIKLLSDEPLKAAPETLENARQIAQRIFDEAYRLPHTAQSSIMLTLAVAVLHHTGRE